MRRRAVLLIALVVLGVVAFVLWRRDRGTTLAGPLTDFAIADTAAVTRIFIAEAAGGTVDLRRGSDGWTVNGLPANPHPVELLLKTFLRIEVKSPVPKSAEANTLRVMAGTAKKVEIYAGNEVPEKIWYVGHATQDHFGTYMLLEIPGKGKSSVPYSMNMSGFSGFLSTRFHARLDEWRSTVVFRYPDLSRVASVSVEHPGSPATSFRIVHAEGKLGLLDQGSEAVPMDAVAVQDLMLQLKDLHFEAIERSVSKALRDSVTATVPLHVVTIARAGGGEQRVPFWRKPAYAGQKNMEFEPMQEDLDRMYALLDDTMLVVVQRHLFDRITPPIEALQHR